MIMKRNLWKGLEWMIWISGIVIFAGLALQPREEINEAILITLAFLGGSLLVNLSRTELGAWKESLAAALLAGILTLQLSITEVWKAPCILWAGPYWKLLLAGGIFLNFFLAIRKLFLVALNAQPENTVWKSRYAREKRGWGIRFCKGAILLESLVFLGSTYPGIWMMYDVPLVYDQAVTNSWNAWHTIGYVWFVKLCTLIYNSTFTVNVVQTILWILVNFYIIDMLDGFHQYDAYFYTALICFSVSPFLYLEIMYKDTVYSMGALALTAVLYKIIRTEEISRMDLIMLLSVPLFTVLCRHGGMVPVVAACAGAGGWSLARKKRENARKLFGAAIWFLGIWFLVNTVLSSVFQVVKNPSYIKYTVPISMIGAAVNQGVEFDSEDTRLLEQVMPLERWAECYNPYFADDLSREWGKIGEDVENLEKMIDQQGFGKDIIRMNLQLLLRHPFIYLRAFFDMNSLVWEVALPQGSPLMALTSNAEDPELIRYNGAYSITEPISRTLNQYPLTRPLVARGGVALFVLLFAAGVMIWKNKAMIFAFLPIGLITGMLAISIPAQDPRYILPALECSIFFLAVLLSQMVRKKGERKNG